jgi:hypothetical protein
MINSHTLKVLNEHSMSVLSSLSPEGIMNRNDLSHSIVNKWRQYDNLA